MEGFGVEDFLEFVGNTAAVGVRVELPCGGEEVFGQAAVGVLDGEGDW